MSKRSSKTKQNISSKSNSKLTNSMSVKPSTKSFFKIPFVHVFLIIFFTFLSYTNVFWNDYAFDDNTFIVEWEERKDFKNLGSLLGGDLPSGHEGVFRPMRSVLYMITYYLWEDNIFGYHLQSILIHLVCCLLIYLIINKIILNKTISLLASLLFSVHPIHVESITFMTASFDMYGVIFFLLSFYLYLLSKEYVGLDVGYKEINKRFCYLFSSSMFFAILAFFTYELTLSLFFIMVLYEICFNFSFPNKKEQNNNYLKILFNLFKQYKQILYYTVPYFFTLIIYFILRSSIASIDKRSGYLADSFYHTMLLMSKAIYKYISLMFIPINLSLDHLLMDGFQSYKKEISVSNALSLSLFNREILFSLFIIFIFLFIALYCYKKYPFVTFGIGWFFLALLPASNIIPGATLFAERYAYIASIGFCMGFAFLLFESYKFITQKSKQMAVAILFFIVVILFVFSALTIQRNFVWKDNITLYTDTVEKNPISLISILNLGHEYYQVDDYEKATNMFRMALAIKPDYADAHNNLGTYYHDTGQIQKAIESYETAIGLEPDFAKAHYNLGYVYHDIGKTDIAFAKYQKALSLEELPEIYLSLGVVYRDKGDLNAAVEHYKKAIELSPNYADAYNNLGAAYKGLDDIDSAMLNYKIALSLDSNLVEAHYNLGLIYKSQKKCDLAISSFKRALIIYPELYQAYNSIGNCYELQGEIGSAIEEYKKALLINPEYKRAKDNLERLVN